MPNTVSSPNMNMPVPVVGTDPGPDWGNHINACLSITDGHSHTIGQGVPITPQAMNINADLPMSGNNLTTTRSVRFSPQSAPIAGSSDLGCLYEQGVDLFYIDGAGNHVRITQGGSVTGATGTITGLPSGTASASFAGSTFTFQSATNTPATMSVGPVVIGQPVASGFHVTVSPNVAQGSNYALTLPLALPTVQSAFVSDSAGNESFLALSMTTYTPTITNGAGGTGFVADGPFMVTRIGNNVMVAGRVVFSPSSVAAAWTMTIPVARTDGVFTTLYQAQGNITHLNAAGTVESDTSSTQLVNCTLVSTVTLAGAAAVQFTYSLVNI